MAKPNRSTGCDSALLSAYYDDLLSAPDRTWMEQHLQTCLVCRQELVAWQRLSSRLRILPVAARFPAPAIVERPTAMPASGRPRFRSSAALASAALVLVVLYALVFQRAPASLPTLVDAYPPAGADNVSTDTSITITFPTGVDHAAVQQSLRIDPPVPFDVAWDSAVRAVVIPLVPLAPSTTYTVEAQVGPLRARPTAPAATPPAPAPPQTLTVFHTAQFATERDPSRILPRVAVADRASAGTSHQVLAVAATPSPVARPGGVQAVAHDANARPAPTAGSRTAVADPASRPAGATPVGTVKAATAQVQGATPAPAPAAPRDPSTAAASVLAPACAPAAPFNTLYRSRPDVRAALGCVAGPARPATTYSQAFQRGVLLAVFPEGLLFELTMDGTWRSAPLGADEPISVSSALPIGPTFRTYWATHAALSGMLGLPIAPEEAKMAAFQPFVNGFMLATNDWTYIADDGGQWQRLVLALPGSSDTSVTGGVASFPPLRSRGTLLAVETASPSPAPSAGHLVAPATPLASATPHGTATAAPTPGGASTRTTAASTGSSQPPSTAAPQRTPAAVCSPTAAPSPRASPTPSPTATATPGIRSGSTVSSCS